MWFGQTGLNINRFETGLSASVNGLRNTEYLITLPQLQINTYEVNFMKLTITYTEAAEGT